MKLFKNRLKDSKVPKEQKSESTDKDSSEDELSFYKNLVENSSTAFFRTTLDGKFIFATNLLLKLLGYKSLEELLSVDVQTQVFDDPADREKLIKILETQGRVKNYRVKLKKKDGSPLIVRVSERLIADDKTNQKFIEGDIQDITNQFKSELKLKKEVAELRIEKQNALKQVIGAKNSGNIKAQFLASMSHEIKTPINSVVGLLTLIEKGLFKSTDELKDFANNAKIAVDSLLDIVNNVLDISKIEAGKMKLDETEFNFREEIKKTESIITPSALKKKLNVSFNVTDEIPDLLFGDPTRLRQIILNLLSNAVKFTEGGEVSLRAELLNKTKENAKVKISVTDTGKGIADDEIPLLFKPYTQVKDKKWSEKDGSGLGLMISKEFVNLMDGDIEIFSDLGIGTTVEFTAVLKIQTESVKETEDELSEKKDSVEKESEPSETVSADENLKINESSEESIVAELEEQLNVTQKQAVPEKTKESPIKDREGDKIQTVNQVNRQRKRLLLVEDNPISQKVEKKILSEFGYDIDTVSNGKDAIDAVNNGEYNLILMDIEMPDMDGIEATKIIRDMDTPKCEVPIIAVTANSSMKDREKCLAGGMNDYISKPININFMRMTIDQWLRRASL